VGRDIVDTYFHASRFPCTTRPNTHAFLLHEGIAWKTFQKHCRLWRICYLLGQVRLLILWWNVNAVYYYTIQRCNLQSRSHLLICDSWLCMVIPCDVVFEVDRKETPSFCPVCLMIMWREHLLIFYRVYWCTCLSG